MMNGHSTYFLSERTHTFYEFGALKLIYFFSLFTTYYALEWILSFENVMECLTFDESDDGTIFPNNWLILYIDTLSNTERIIVV